tara:strand:- start:1314 stop:1562 length:249 start_codon:yes stop_codon:yes gene_type:complete
MTLETAKMSERGQIIIPKDVRDYIHAEGNTIFTVMPLDNETIIMKKLDTNKLINEFRNIRKHSAKLSPAEIQEEVRNARKSK